MPQVVSARRRLEQVWWGVVVALGVAIVAGVVTLALLNGNGP
jgi:hypothetical protein